MNGLAVETSGLRKAFGPVVAVADLSLAIGQGEVFGFLGPNGAGKTTAIKMLLGLIRPTSGGGHVLGAPLGDRAARARVGFLPEHFRFHECFTARELLRFHGRLCRVRRADLEARIDLLLARVDLVDAADRRLRDFSKGMVQRAGLAQALINDPDLVFFEEPTSGLDPLGRLLVRDIIDELRARGVTVFLNSHLLSEVQATCDRVAVVNHGRVIRGRSLAERSAEGDLELHVTPVDRALLDGLASFGTLVTRLADDRVRVRVDRSARVPDIVAWLVSRRVSVHAVEMHRPSLEEWFVTVMRDGQRPG